MTARILLPDAGASPLHVLSKTSAGILLATSPLHARLRKLKETREEPTDEMDLGTIVHELLLGNGKGFAVAEYTEASADEDLAALVDRYEETGELPGEEPAELPAKGKKPRKKKPVEPPPIAKETGRPEWQDWKRGDAQRARAAIRSRGLVPILPKHHRMALAGAKKLRAECERLGFPFDGESEVAIEWSEIASNGDEVTCWGALDHVLIGARGAHIYDLKILESAHPRAVRQHLHAFGGDIQAAAYTRAVEALHPHLAGRISFTFLACEITTGIVTPVGLNGEFRRLGEIRWQRAVDTWAHCLRTDTWPAYVTERIELDPAPWALAEETDTVNTINAERGEAFMKDD